MKRISIPVAVLAALLAFACEEQVPEPEVSGNSGGFEQPTTPPSMEPVAEVAEESSSDPIDDIPRIELDEVVELKDAGEVVIVDVRASRYYMEGHIPGAINIPAGQTVQMIDMLPKGKKIVTYCT